MKKNYLIILSTLLLVGATGCTSPLPTLQPRQNTVSATPISTTTVTSTTMPVSDTTIQNGWNNEKPTPAKLEQYQNTMRTVASGIKDDANYQRIALDTAEKKEWFKDLTYKLWDKQITSEQFLAQGLAKYPTHQYELQFIINGFDKAAN